MIKTFLLIIYNVLRVSINKLTHWGQFDVHWLQRISPLCALKVFRQGIIRVGRNCEFAAYCDFEAHGKGLLEIGEGTYFNRYCMISAHEHVKVGKHCMFGGQSGVVGHIKLAPHTTVAAQAGVIGNVRKIGEVLIGMPAIPRTTFMRAYAKFKASGEE